MDDQLKVYLNHLLPQRDQQWITEMELYAKENRVPIMEKTAIHFLLQLIQIQQPNKILEVGTAIGYSVLRMLEAAPEAKIVTLEKDEERHDMAVHNIKKQGKETNIDVLLGDALENMEKLNEQNEKFDFIFIDAAKGEYKRYFELSDQLINSNGVIVCDNILFRGYVANVENSPPRIKNIVKKIRAFNEWLTKHPNYSTSFVPIGDGVSISYKV